MLGSYCHLPHTCYHSQKKWIYDYEEEYDEESEEEEFVDMKNIDDHALFLVGKTTMCGREIKINNQIFTYVYYKLVSRISLGLAQVLIY